MASRSLPPPHCCPGLLSLSQSQTALFHPVHMLFLVPVTPFLGCHLPPSCKSQLTWHFLAEATLLTALPKQFLLPLFFVFTLCSFLSFALG